MELMKQNPNLKLKFASIFRQNDQAKKEKKVVYVWASVPKCEDSLDHLGLKSTATDLLNLKKTKYTL